ncbi:hypothetical protein G5C51_38165 [Streptomyces sp. A7024]|uniref:Secreted protein n=1 Tax=Streptomyces coryli TaxID=1128680 RepID=A0A6G4UDB0_9ACTN|nr:hypothetical protein [Streptomyces coryli]NGN69700.1 hypothetical protein [Streptomyces coryli]
MRRTLRLLAYVTAPACAGAVLLTGCSEGGKPGYAAVGAEAPAKGPTSAEPPKAEVSMVPLPKEKKRPEGDRGGSSSPSGGGESGDAGTGGSSGSSGDDKAGGSSRTPEGSAPAGGGSSSAPAGPAVLKTSDPKLATTDKRWCNKVTLRFTNSGDSPVRSGTVKFGTHVIGALGVDWATIEGKRELPAPIGSGDSVTKTWTVCVEEWRVPIGMHVETQDVDVDWK